MAQPNIEADKMLDVYIYDYFMKRKLSASARAFQAEAEIPNRTAIDAPGGFLYEWWSVFWDVFIARYKQPGPSITGCNNSQGQQDMPQQLQQMQQLIQRQIMHQQQQRERRNVTQVQNATAGALQRQNLGLMHTSATRVHETRSMPPYERDRLLSFNPLLEQNRQFPMHQDMRNLMNPTVNAANSDGSLFGVPGYDHGANILPLKGWPLMGLDRLQAGLLQQQKSHMLTSQQHQMQQQLNVLVDLQKNVTTHNNTQSNSRGSIVPNHIQSRTDAEVLAKSFQQLVESGYQYQLHSSRSSLPEVQYQSNLFHRQDNLVARTDTSFPVPSPGNEQASNNHITRKRKQPICEDPTNGSETAKTRSLDNNVELVAHDSANTKCLDTNKDFTYSQIGNIQVTAFNCFDFSSNGKLISTGGLDKKVVLWCTNFGEPQYMIEEHSDAITDIRFAPRLQRLATSSMDKTVKIWDVDNSDNSFRTFIGHSAPVVSVDFHPKRADFICSSDEIGAIRYWNIRDGGCAGVSKGGATQVRFQPASGKYLAAAVGTGISVIDVETTQTCRYPFKCHKSKVQSVCWNASGEYLASMSEDSVKVWKIGPGEKQEFIHELSLEGKKFHCCIFHPDNPSLMVIGLEQSLELWHMGENKMMTIHRGTTTALAVAQLTGVIASATDDSSIKLWK